MENHIPERWMNLKLEYTDEYIVKKKNKDKKNQKHPDKLEQPDRIIVKNPLKDKPVSILKNKDDVNYEYHRCGECYNRYDSKKSSCIIL